MKKNYDWETSASSKPVMVYIGCGNDRLKDFIHIEINLWKNQVGHPDVLADISEHIPLNDGVADLVFSRATMEHLTYRELLNCLLETRRILKRGGAVRMVLPDMDKIVEDYHNKVYATDLEKNPDFPNENYADTFSAQITYHDHYYNHTFDTMRRALEKAGFEKIRKCQPADSIIKPANEALKIAEADRNYDMIIEATKLDKEPTAKMTPKQWPKNPIAKILARYLNIRIAPFVERKAKFPQKYWFKGLFFNKWRQYKKEFPWNIID